jgi:two-component system nitrogen regulation sensor histidine kinase NtrY
VPARDETLPSGEIRVELVDEPGRRAIVVDDNGCGLPKKQRQRLTEPYVTTRLGGTGLGLAIGRKIMEDHHGPILLQDRPRGGARAILRFPSPDEAPFHKSRSSQPEKRKALTHGV